MTTERKPVKLGPNDKLCTPPERTLALIDEALQPNTERSGAERPAGAPSSTD